MWCISRFSSAVLYHCLKIIRPFFFLLFYPYQIHLESLTWHILFDFFYMEARNTYQEISKLKAKYESLQRSHRSVFFHMTTNKARSLLIMLQLIDCFTCNFLHLNLFDVINSLRPQNHYILILFRNLLGEDLGPLSLKELQQLERQLESALSQARQRRVKLFLVLESHCEW